MFPYFTKNEKLQEYMNKTDQIYKWLVTEKNYLTESQFLSVLRMRIPESAGLVFDRIDFSVADTYQKVKEILIPAVDGDEQDSLSEFHRTLKQESETYSTFAHRLLNLYCKGMNLDTKTALSKSDQITVVNRFCRGICPPDARTLRLTATEAELIDVLLLAKRAQRLNHDSVSLPQTVVTQDTSNIDDLVRQIREELNTKEDQQIQEDNQDNEEDNQLFRINNEDSSRLKPNNSANDRMNDQIQFKTNKAGYGFNKGIERNYNSNWRNHQNNFHRPRNNTRNCNVWNDYQGNRQPQESYHSSYGNNRGNNYRTNNYRGNSYQNNNNRENSSRGNFGYNNRPQRYSSWDGFNNQGYNQNYNRNQNNANSAYQQRDTQNTYRQFNNNNTKKQGNCLYCGIQGHYWRECRKRERAEPNWLPNNSQHAIDNIIKILETESSKRRQPQIDVTFVNPTTDSMVVIRCLADSGSAITCANADLPFFNGIEREQRTTWPTGADGKQLDYKGEVYVDL